MINKINHDKYQNNDFIKSNSESLKYIAQWDEKTSDIVLKEIKDEDFYKKRKENKQT